MSVKQRKGFTLIELLVVIAVIALLISIVVPALSKAKIYAQKVVCKNNIRQQCLGTMLYADDNDSFVPNTRGGAWLWDVSFYATDQLSHYAGFDKPDVFFCEANRQKKPDDARFWQFGWLWSEGGTHPNPVSIRDESALTIDEKKNYYRVLPIVYMFDKYDETTRQSYLNDKLVNGQDANWIRKLSNIRNSGSKTMVMDAVISANSWQFTNITDGGIWSLSGGTLTDDTNHLSRQTIGSGAESGPKPDGANVGYADGHVDWRDFESMQHQYTHGMQFWW